MSRYGEEARRCIDCERITLHGSRCEECEDDWFTPLESPLGAQRERAVPCRRCQGSTWNHLAVCDRCLDASSSLLIPEDPMAPVKVMVTEHYGLPDRSRSEMEADLYERGNGF